MSGNRCNGTTALPLALVIGLRNGFSSITHKELEGCYFFVILQSDSLLESARWTHYCSPQATYKLSSSLLTHCVEYAMVPEKWVKGDLRIFTKI